jgi:hypothetical protein
MAWLIVMEVGVKNAVQLVLQLTINAANYIFVSCCRKDIPHIVQTSAKKIVDQAKSITKFIYKNARILNLMRKDIGGKELLWPTITRFATNFEPKKQFGKNVLQ